MKVAHFDAQIPEECNAIHVTNVIFGQGSISRTLTNIDDENCFDYDNCKFTITYLITLTLFIIAK